MDCSMRRAKSEQRFLPLNGTKPDRAVLQDQDQPEQIALLEVVQDVARAVARAVERVKAEEEMVEEEMAEVDAAEAVDVEAVVVAVAPVVLDARAVPEAPAPPK